MQKAIQTAVVSDKSTENLELTYEYLQRFRKTIEDNMRISIFWNKQKINSWTKLFDNLEKQMQKIHVVSDYDNLSYTFTVPSLGDYHGYILLDEGRSLRDDSVKMNVLLNNNQIATYSAKQIENNHTLALGLLSISSVMNKLSLQITNKENLIDNLKWNAVGQMPSATINSGGILFSPDLKITSQRIYNNPVIYQEIKEWTPGAIYLLKIRHSEQEGATLSLRLEERKQVYNYKTDVWNTSADNIIAGNIPTKPGGDEYKVLATADKNATSAWIYLSGVNGTAKIESIALERIIVPNIYFINENNHQNVSMNQQTTVNFTKIDPTKYKVTFKNIINSSFLVFSETFDRGWKMYGKDNAYLPETQHFLVNGYANAWIINPQNTNSNNSMQLLFEYIPQRFFYIGAIISMLALCICCVYGIYIFFRKRRYNK